MLGGSDCFGHYEKQVCFPKLPFSFFLICQSWLFVTELLGLFLSWIVASARDIQIVFCVLKGKHVRVAAAQVSVRDSIFSWCD